MATVAACCLPRSVSREKSEEPWIKPPALASVWPCRRINTEYAITTLKDGNSRSSIHGSNKPLGQRLDGSIFMAWSFIESWIYPRNPGVYSASAVKQRDHGRRLFFDTTDCWGWIQKNERRRHFLLSLGFHVCSWLNESQQRLNLERISSSLAGVITSLLQDRSGRLGI
jgi:hypothetical protein